MVTKEEAANNVVFHFYDGHRCRNWRRNGMLQTWKRSPERFYLPLKYGLRDYWYLTEDNADRFHLPDSDECKRLQGK